MIKDLPSYVNVTFILTTISTLLLFLWTIKNSNSQWSRKNSGIVVIVLSAWLIFQAVLSLKNVYHSEIIAFPPKILILGILPALLSILLLFVSKRGKRFIDSLPLLNLTVLSLIRLPVEIILFWLFLNKTIPEIMTFEGRNFDIIAGITAPLVAYYGFIKQKISRKIILLWNLVCLGLLINIVLLAFFSMTTPMQKFAFDQPNIAILYFPFSWLPTFIVPIIIFSHLSSIRQLFRN